MERVNVSVVIPRQVARVLEQVQQMWRGLAMRLVPWGEFHCPRRIEAAFEPQEGEAGVWCVKMFDSEAPKGDALITVRAEELDDEMHILNVELRAQDNNGAFTSYTFGPKEVSVLREPSIY